MPVRIYALAKELNLDSKVLVGVCAKAGISGKGSALASLSDDDVAKVKGYLSGKKEAKEAAAPQDSVEVPRRPADTVPSSAGSKPAGSKSAGSKSAKPAAPASPQPVAKQNQALRREDYIAPTGVGSGKSRSLSGKPRPVVGKSTAGKKSSSELPKPPPRAVSPQIKLAPMPASRQPVAPKKKDEPAPQKPDLKLPVDAIRASKVGGGKPLSEHLRKHEEKRKAAATPAGFSAKKREGTKERKEPVRGHGKAAVGKAGAAPLGGREMRQLVRKKSTSSRRSRNRPEDEGRQYRRSRRPSKRTGVNTAAPRKGNVTLEMPCTVRSFSEAVGVPARTVLGKLLGMNLMANINSNIDSETVELLAMDFGVELDFKCSQDIEDQLFSSEDTAEENAEDLVPRAPVVTFLGHVDHGKTSLLDKVIDIDVVSGESGGITQHIRAYQIEKNGRKISFVDTPGHEAFTQMRARGASVTDIAVLVVAADDGVMPQTEEAISHAKAAEVPIVVALNKIDLPGANPQKVLEQLATAGLLPTEWGGDIEVVRTSAITGEGLDELLETLLTIAELHELKANPTCAGYGTCLESELHEGRGVVSKMLVQKGTLKVGDVVVCGTTYGRVKAIYDTLHPEKQLTEPAGPSCPVNMTGLNEPPGAGEHFYVVDDIATAREIAEKRSHRSREAILSGAHKHVTLETLFDRLGSDKEVQTLNVILRADVRGSIEAIQKELGKLEHPEVAVRVLQATVGGVSEADVHLADASDAVILAFNVVPDEAARALSEELGVQIRRYEIIYKLTEDLKAALEGMLKPEQREKELGRALVQRTFSVGRVGVVAGCRVIGGIIERNSRIRVIRDNRIIGDYPLESLRREKDDAREVRDGLECGIKLAGFNDIKEGDVLESYKVEEIARVL